MSFKNQLYSRLGNNTKHLSQLTQSTIRPLLQLAIKSLEQDYIPIGALDKLNEKFNVNHSLINEWYSAILTIVRLHLRCPVQSINQTKMKNILQELKFSEECAGDIITVLYGLKRTDVITKYSKSIKLLPDISSIKWSINIAIASKFSSRILEPIIVMEWMLSNGETYIFQMSVQKFHELRHTVAKLLLDVVATENIKSIKSLHA